MPIGAVTQLTGISGHTLRKWESRYGAIEPVRTETGRRMYTQTHVRRLVLLRDLIRLGHQIGQLGGMCQIDQRPACLEGAGLWRNLANAASGEGLEGHPVLPDAALAPVEIAAAAAAPAAAVDASR